LDGGSALSRDRYLHTKQHKHKEMRVDFIPRVGLEPTIPVLEQAKTVHALGREATVIGNNFIMALLNYENINCIQYEYMCRSR
jgi:hypothetical protein